MNKKIFLIILILLTLTGCSFIDVEISKVEIPTISKTPISGKWIITKAIFKENSEYKLFEYKDLIGKDVIFSNKGALVSNYYTENSKYRAKKVNANRYLQEIYNISKDKLNVDKDYLYVIEVYDRESLFYEILKISDDISYIYMDGVFLQISKVSEDISDDEFKEAIKDAKLAEDKTDELKSGLSENGLALGIKYNVNSEDNTDFKYETLLFKFKDYSVDRFAEYENILIPRQNKFSKIEVNRVEDDNRVDDEISIENLSNNTNNKIGEGIDFKSKKEINFVSDNYLSFTSDSLRDENKKSFNFYYLGMVNVNKKISLSDMVENGDEIFIESSKNQGKGKKSIYYNDLDITIKRSEGHYKLFGNLVVKNGEDIVFPINILIPKSILRYDNLLIPYLDIKNMFPNAKDALISPNNRFLILLENKKIVIYNIVNGKVKKDIVYEVEIPENSEVIMSLWYVGRETELWDKAFK